MAKAIENIRSWLTGTPGILSADTLEFWQDEERDWRWKITAGNLRIVAASSEGFATAANAKRNYKRVKNAMRSALKVVETPLADLPPKKGRRNGP